MTSLQSEETPPVIEIRGLTKWLGSFHLGPLDITVPTGAVYGLIGPNGAGKTTTLELLMGMFPLESGSIRIFGMDHRLDEVAVKRRIGYVSPEISFNAWGRIDKLFKFLKPYYPTWDDAHAAGLLRRFGLAQDAEIKTLSMGNRMRLALSAALAHRPELLILDEPTTGLDPLGRHQFFEEMMTLMQDERCSVLLSSHNMSDLERYADHIGLIKQGRMLLETRIDQIADRFRLADVELSGAAILPAGTRVLRREGTRARLLLDGLAPEQLIRIRPGITLLHESSLTLDELFVGLIEKEQVA